MFSTIKTISRQKFFSEFVVKITKIDKIIDDFVTKTKLKIPKIFKLIF